MNNIYLQKALKKSEEKIRKILQKRMKKDVKYFIKLLEA